MAATATATATLPIVTCTLIESRRTADRSFLFNVAGVVYDLPELEGSLHHLTREDRFVFLNDLIEHPDKIIHIA